MEIAKFQIWTLASNIILAVCLADTAVADCQVRIGANDPEAQVYVGSRSAQDLTQPVICTDKLQLIKIVPAEKRNNNATAQKVAGSVGRGTLAILDPHCGQDR